MVSRCESGGGGGGAGAAVVSASGAVRVAELAARLLPTVVGTAAVATAVARSMMATEPHGSVP